MAAFSAAKHPRDKMGRFASKAGAALAGGARAIGRSATKSGAAENLGGSFGRGVGAATGIRIGGHIGKHVGRRIGKNEDLGDAIGSLAGGAIGQRLGRDAGDKAGRVVGMKPVAGKSFARKVAGVAGFMAAGNAELPGRGRSGAGDSPGGLHPGVAKDIASAVRRGSRTRAQKFADRMHKTIRLRSRFAYRDASIGGKAAIRARGLAKAMKKALKKKV